MADDKQIVLIVDDDHVILDFLEDVLQGSYTVIRADNGKAAVEAFGAHENIDLVLLDLAMPLMSGYEALAEIQIMAPDVKVVVVTGVIPVHENLPGILGVLTKPFGAAQIAATVKDVLNTYSP